MPILSYLILNYEVSKKQFLKLALNKVYFELLLGANLHIAKKRIKFVGANSQNYRYQAFKS